MLYMFNKASNFNQDIGSWDVSNVIQLERMFAEASVFNQDLSSWSVSNVDYCGDFAIYAPAWTEPKPTFTNCTE
jgi:surface protein